MQMGRVAAGGAGALLFKKFVNSLNSILRAENPAFHGKVKFCTAARLSGQPAVQGERRVCCAPLRTAAAYPFSFPFGRKVNLRGALELKFRSIAGEGGALMMIPQATERGASSTRGAAWFASREEIEDYEKALGGRAALIPAPLALLSEVGGCGLVIWREAGCSCALWAEDYEPKLYRCFSDEECRPDEAARWMRGYAQSAGGEIAPENVRIFDAAEISPEELQRAGEATFAASPSSAALDFSNSGASAAERREGFFASAFFALRAATAAGLFCLVLSLALLAQNVFMKDSFASAPSEIYSLALGEESRAPLTSVTRRLRAVSGGGVQLSFDGVLSGVAAAWKQMPDTMRLDALRYGIERTELEGRAQNTGDLQALRDALSKNGFTVRLGDVQQIPGGGMRFSLHLSEGGRGR